MQLPEESVIKFQLITITILIQTSTTPDPGHHTVRESDKDTRKHNTLDPRCQPFPSR